MRRVIPSTLTILGLAAVGVVPEAAAQVRPAMVRSVDEPARVPYSHSLSPTCPFGNQCVATFPTIPAGKRLRLTSVSLLFFNTSPAGVLAVNRNGFGDMLAAFRVAPFSAGYYGTLTSSTEQVDLYFEAGEVPALEFGIGAGLGGITADGRNRFSVSGYLVDVLP